MTSFADRSRAIFGFGSLSMTEVDVRQVFEEFDVDGSGALDKSELQILCGATGRMVTGDDLQHLFRRLDSNGDGVIQFDEFLTWWSEADSGTSTEPQSLQSSFVQAALLARYYKRMLRADFRQASDSGMPMDLAGEHVQIATNFGFGSVGESPAEFTFSVRPTEVADVEELDFPEDARAAWHVDLVIADGAKSLEDYANPMLEIDVHLHSSLEGVSNHIEHARF